MTTSDDPYMRQTRALALAGDEAILLIAIGWALDSLDQLKARLGDDFEDIDLGLREPLGPGPKRRLLHGRATPMG